MDIVITKKTDKIIGKHFIVEVPLKTDNTFICLAIDNAIAFSAGFKRCWEASCINEKILIKLDF